VTDASVPPGAEVADLVDRLLQRPALVVGSLPPYGRDLDVLVDDLDAEPLARGLRGAGFAGSGGVWRRGTGYDGRPQEVDVTTAAEWDLPAEELHWLRDGAGVLPPWGRLRQPALAAVLLLLARRDLGERPLGPRHAARLHEASAPGAVEQARFRAPAWRVEHALEVLLHRGSGRRPPALVLHRSRVERARRAGRAGPLVGLRVGTRTAASGALSFARRA